MNGDFLRKKIEDSGFQLFEVAKNLGITQQNLQSKLKTSDVKVSFLEDLASAINKNVYYFFEDSNKTKSTENVIKKNDDKNDDNFDDKPKVKKMSSNEQEEEEPPYNIVSLPSNRRTKDAIYPIQEVPLYDLEATAGLKELFSGGKSATQILDTIRIPHLPKCDGAISITGDSMYPLLKSGDMVLYKEIPLDSIFYGEMYLLAYQIDEWEEYITVKYVQKSELGEGYLKLVSQNQHHQPKDVKKAQITAIALIKASIRINTMM